jgi:glutamate 5-kinase
MKLIVKVGTNILANSEGVIDSVQLNRIVDALVVLLQAGHTIALVSSGAIGAGRGVFPQAGGPLRKRVWAALGQPVLMQNYIEAFRRHGMIVGQCLLLRNDFSNRERYENFINTVQGMIDCGAVPVINENDVVATADLTVGDNDQMAAMAAIALGADKLILLTNQKGLFKSNPDHDSSTELISEVANVDRELERLCSSESSALGRGGMLSKVRAAKHAVHAGIETYIADGRTPEIISDLVGGKPGGTRFVPFAQPPTGVQQRWLLAAKGFGQIIIDDGAVTALRSGKSLLFPGIVTVKGLFDSGEIVEVIAKSGEGVAYGKSAFDHQTLLEALAQRKGGAPGKMDREVIHRNYMAVVTK